MNLDEDYIMEKAIFTQEPEKFKRDPDGSTVFRWDIAPTKIDEVDHFESKECRIYGTPTQENIEKGALEAQYPQVDQNNLVHDNLKSMIDIGQPTTEYVGFLTERQRIKALVAEYFTIAPMKTEPVVSEVSK